MNIEDDVKVEGGICNRVRIQYGTGIGYGYCLVRPLGLPKVRRYEILGIGFRTKGLLLIIVSRAINKEIVIIDYIYIYRLYSVRRTAAGSPVTIGDTSRIILGGLIIKLKWAVRRNKNATRKEKSAKQKKETSQS